jgi:Sec-independent protein translocase protein TatA
MLVGWVSTAVPAIAFIVFAADSLPVVFNGMNRALNPAAKQAWEERHWFVQAFRDAQAKAEKKKAEAEPTQQEQSTDIDEKTLETGEGLQEAMTKAAAELKEGAAAEKELAEELEEVARKEEDL